MARIDRPPSVSLVVPCFDEAARLSSDGLAALLSDPDVGLVLVDDGSSDATLEVLRRIESTSERVAVLPLTHHVGKGEAVRLGLERALERGSDWIGYVDADFSTPPSEVGRLVAIALDRPDVDVVMGARVAMLGRSIGRSRSRHYPGRIFATFASIVLGKPVYDTQCGAKVLRVGTPLRRALARPFRSRWAFDVELLGRLDREGVPPTAFWEEPLLEWRDAPGSKRTLLAAIRATCDLWAIGRDLRRWGA